MANIKQAIKRAKQAEKRRLRNKWQKSRANTFIKRVIAAVEAKDSQKAQADFSLATSFLDKLASKGIIHKNKAARHKSRLSKKIKALEAA